MAGGGVALIGTTYEKRNRPEVTVHKTGFEKQILWQLPDKGC